MYTIVLATDDNYAPYCAATIDSICKNVSTTHNVIQFYILHENLSEKSKRLISRVPEDNYYIALLDFVDVSLYDFSVFDQTIDYISKATYYRLVLPELLSDVDECLYLDCDLMAVDAINELLEYDISNHYIGAVEEEQSISNAKRLGLQNYFNAGVLLLNLKKLREDDYVEKFFDIYAKRKNDLVYQDQDILNLAFDSTEVFWLPLKWNVTNTVFHTDIFANASYCVAEERKTRSNPSIVHFNGVEKPWHFCCCHPYKFVWLRYLLNTCFTTEIVKQIFFLLVSAIFKIDRTYKEFSIRLFTIKVLKLYGHTSKSLTLFGLRIY